LTYGASILVRLNKVRFGPDRSIEICYGFVRIAQSIAGVRTIVVCTGILWICVDSPIILIYRATEVTLFLVYAATIVESQEGVRRIERDGRAEIIDRPIVFMLVDPG
jgi:hypothetical protein